MAQARQRGVAFAKTTRPAIGSVVPRQALFERLDGSGRAVAWISGPPGCGKTTLAASYVEARNRPCIWYQLDEGDADVASFFYHLGGAAAGHRTRKSAPLPRLTPEYHAGIAAFTRRYFQALYRLLGADFALVFDGYHEVPAQSALHEVMRVALSEVPPGGHVIVASRRDPPPSLARLRANRALEVLGWEDLRLTREESNAMLARRGQRLPPESAARIYERTQGWAAGLILLLDQAITRDSLAAAPDMSAPQVVFDYLAGEIFQNSDSRTREFLLRTAYLPQMTADMACALTGQDDAPAILDEMFRNNYFVTLRRQLPQSVYQYHPLLRDFLLARANETFDRERRVALQQQSADLLEAEGQVVDAASLARSVGDWDRLVVLIERHGPRMFGLGMGETLALWVDTLPKEVQERNPWTLYWKAASRMRISPRESRLLYELAFERFGAPGAPDPRGLLLAASGAMDAILYEVDDFSLLDRWITVVERLLQQHPELLTADIEARVATSLVASMSVRQPHHPDLPRWVERGYRAARMQEDPELRMLAEWRVALSIMWEGHLPKALAVIEDMRKLAAGSEVSPFALTTLKLAEATYFMLANERDACLAAIRSGLEIERAEGVNVLSYQLLANGAGGALMAGDPDTAEALIREFAALGGAPARFDLCLHHLFSAWLALLRGDSVAAYQQQKLALTMAIEVGCPTYVFLCHLAAAQVLYEGGEERKALAHLQLVYDIARPIQSHLVQFTGLMIYAYIVLERGRRTGSGLRSLRYSLEIAKPRNFTAFLLWRPEMLARLCSHALENGIETDFVSAIVRKRGLALDASRDALAGWPWPYRVRALGPFRLFRKGSALTFSGKAQRRPLELLKVVIAGGGRDVSATRVTEAMWPRIDGDSAHRSFTSTLHRLRKLLGEDRAVVLSEGKLRLDGRYVWTDCWAFEQMTTRLDQLLRGPRERVEPDKLGALCDRLLDLYAGPFLGDETDEAWSLAMRERLRSRFVRSMGEISRYWQNAAQPERAAGLLERALEADNLAESLYRHLMLCHAQAQHRAEAIETYNRCRKTFAAVLKVEPSPETTAIYQKLLASV
jgi:LuxR family maltose regulon positive regulatory protein